MGLFDDLAKDKALSFGLLNSGLSILANNRGANKGIPSILSGLQNGISGYTTMDKFLREKRIKDKTEARQNELMHRLSGGAYGQGNQSSQSQLPPINRPRNNQIGINGGGLTGQGFDSPSQTDIADIGQISQQMPPASTDTTANSNSMSLDPQQVLALAMQYPDLELSKQLIDSVKASQFYVPKFKADNQIVNLGNGKLGIAKFDDKGNETISELTPAEKTKVLNLGGQTLQTGEYTGNPVGVYQNTASPGEMLTDARGRASLAQSARHHAEDMAMKQYQMQSGMLQKQQELKPAQKDAAEAYKALNYNLGEVVKMLNKGFKGPGPLDRFNSSSNWFQFAVPDDVQKYNVLKQGIVGQVKGLIEKGVATDQDANRLDQLLSINKEDKPDTIKYKLNQAKLLMNRIGAKAGSALDMENVEQMPIYNRGINQGPANNAYKGVQLK